MIIKVKKLIKITLKKYFVIVPIFAFASYALPTESFLEKITNNNVLSGDEAFIFSAYTQDDERIIGLNQKGVNSDHYVPGPLSNMEWGIKAFHAGYLKQLEKKINLKS